MSKSTARLEMENNGGSIKIFISGETVDIVEELASLHNREAFLNTEQWIDDNLVFFWTTKKDLIEGFTNIERSKIINSFNWRRNEWAHEDNPKINELARKRAVARFKSLPTARFKNESTIQVFGMPVFGNERHILSNFS